MDPQLVEAGATGSIRCQPTASGGQKLVKPGFSGLSNRVSQGLGEAFQGLEKRTLDPGAFVARNEPRCLE